LEEPAVAGIDVTPHLLPPGQRSELGQRVDDPGTGGACGGEQQKRVQANSPVGRDRRCGGVDVDAQLGGSRQRPNLGGRESGDACCLAYTMVGLIGDVDRPGSGPEGGQDAHRTAGGFQFTA